MAEKGGEINEESYKEALKAMNALVSKQKVLEKSSNVIKSAWDGISSNIFGVDGSKFYEKVNKSTDDIIKQAEAYQSASSSLKVMGTSINDAFKNIGNLQGEAKKF